MKLTFDAGRVRALLAHSELSNARRPSYGQIVSPELWRSDMEPDRRALLEAEIAASGLAVSAISTDVDPKLIVPGLWLVGDRGVYLMSNGDDALPEGEELFTYAIQADPTNLSPEVWDPIKIASFGPDDGVEFLDAKSINVGLNGSDRFVLDITPDKISIMVPKDNPATEPGI